MEDELGQKPTEKSPLEK
jgi:hypothetical protein